LVNQILGRGSWPGRIVRALRNATIHLALFVLNRIGLRGSSPHRRWALSLS